MPNKGGPHKHGVRKLGSRSPRTRAHLGSGPRYPGAKPQPTHSVKDLLARTVPVLSQAADRTARQAFWHPWLAARLPPELPPRITGITERDGVLVVFADSSAWSARLRYALQELHAQIQEAQPAIREINIRVMPRTAK